MKTKTTIHTIAATLWLALVSFYGPARVQFPGHNTTGDFGLMSGTRPEPGT